MTHYESIFAIRFNADSDAEACETAARHHQQLRDDLLVEGADHPQDIELRHVFSEGRDVLDRPKDKQITP